MTAASYRVPTQESVPIPSILALARAHSVKGLVLAVIGILLGILLTPFACIGIVLLVISVIGLPTFVRGIIDPTVHDSIHWLGSTKEERLEGLSRVEQELAAPSTTRVTLTNGVACFSDELVALLTKKTLVVVRHTDLIWLWQTVEKKTFLKIPYGEKRTVRYVLRRGDLSHPNEFLLPSKDAHLLAALEQAVPDALYGYNAEWFEHGTAPLEREVDRRRAARLGPFA